MNSLRFRYFADLSYCPQLNYVRQQWYCYNWLKKRLSWKDNNSWNVTLVNNKSVKANDTIFVYWKQGWDVAPPLVKICAESIRRQCGKHPVVFLDENTIREYVSFPNFIDECHEKGIIKEALFSDILRICLLINYGGIWCDATCLWTDPVPDYIENTPFFMFQKTKLPEWSSPIKGSNWFLKADKNNQLLVSIRNFLFSYYAEKKDIINYYIFHLILAVLTDCDKTCATILSNTPYVCNMNPHVMQFSFSEKYTYSSFEQKKSQCFIHKLSYKYQPQLLEDKDNVLSYILNNYQ